MPVKRLACQIAESGPPVAQTIRVQIPVVPVPSRIRARASLACELVRQFLHLAQHHGLGIDAVLAPAVLGTLSRAPTAWTAETPGQAGQANSPSTPSSLTNLATVVQLGPSRSSPLHLLDNAQLSQLPSPLTSPTHLLLPSPSLSTTTSNLFTSSISSISLSPTPRRPPPPSPSHLIPARQRYYSAPARHSAKYPLHNCTRAAHSPKRTTNITTSVATSQVKG
ncbi:unnamed protein product [Cutaneotrichosporon oleaginosum]